MALSLFAASILGSTAMAQTANPTTASELTQTLNNFNRQTGLVNIGNVSIPVSNVTVQNLVNVQNVLNNAEINLLNDALNGNSVLNNLSLDLSNLLREAKVLNKNQIIVGLLSDQSGIKFVTQNIKSAAAKKK